MSNTQHALWMLCLLCASCAFNPASKDQGEGPLAIDFGDEISGELSAVLLEDSDLELLAINPDWPTKESLADPETMYGYTVRGRAMLSDRAARLALLSAFARGAHENDSMVAGCFNPRHAIRAEWNGKQCDIVICFECFQFYVYDGTERVKQGLISESPTDEFNRIYQELGLSIAANH